MRMSLGTVLTDPVTGDQVAAPTGSGVPCPLNVNLTGYTPCDCPSGYELDLTTNQCVTPGVVPVIAPQLTEGMGAGAAAGGLSSPVILIGVGVLIYFFMEGGGGGGVGRHHR